MSKRTDGTERPELSEVFLEMATSMARRSTCPEGARHGAIAERSGRVLATGYGSPPAGMHPCPVCWLRKKFDETGVKDFSVCPAVHAESNCVASAARHGVALEGATVHVTRDPCQGCDGLLRNAGVKTIVWPGGWRTLGRK